MPTFSVITANFNSGEKLASTAASVLAQDADFEYLIVDGASTDRSIEIARQLAANNPTKIRLLSEPDRGVYDAMNKGVAVARGRYVMFLGAGDLLFEGVLASVSALLPAHDLGFIYGGVRLSGIVYQRSFTWRTIVTMNICQQAIFYGRTVFDVCGQFNIQYRRWADWEFNLRCFTRDEIVKQYIDVLVCEFEAGGISGADDDLLKRDWNRLVVENLGYLRAYQFFAKKAARSLKYALFPSTRRPTMT